MGSTLLPLTPPIRVRVAESLGALSIYCVGRAARNGGPDEDDKPNSAAMAGMLKFSADTRNAIAQGNVVEAVDFRPKSIEEIPADMGSFMKKGAHYYMKTGFHPRSTGKVHPKSWDLMVNYDSFAFNSLISPRPLLVIGCEDAETLHFAKEAYEAALEPKEIFVVPSKGHFDIYQDASVTAPPGHPLALDKTHARQFQERPITHLEKRQVRTQISHFI